MSDVVIRAESLGKKYFIGHEAEQGSDVTLRDTIMRNVGRLKRSAGDLARGRPLIVGDEVEEFWALKDVSFEICRGEVVGIIGRNGAGKSTLLKVLSRITEPTEGRVTIEGRVASLLEVGTGFHPELSGRENIFLNGSILGMTRKEIQAKFDEIVDFAGVEKFIDTPVKRYSSGMKVRLGFSVAAHLEPEILIVDEVLAVGDAEFQKKCLGKMQDVANVGRTVLFVSHNLKAMQELCPHSLRLEAGKIIEKGSTSTLVQNYLNVESEHGFSTKGRMSQIDKSELRPKITGVKISPLSNRNDEIITIGDAVEIGISLSSPLKEVSDAECSIAIETPSGVGVCYFNSSYSSSSEWMRKEHTKILCRIDELHLSPGTYSMNVQLKQGEQILDWVKGALRFIVVSGDPLSKRTPSAEKAPYAAPHTWLSRSVEGAGGPI